MEHREYGSDSISQRKDGTWTAELIIGYKSDGKSKVKALHGKTEKEVKKKLKEYQKNGTGLETIHAAETNCSRFYAYMAKTSAAP